MKSDCLLMGGTSRVRVISADGIEREDPRHDRGGR